MTALRVRRVGVSSSSLGHRRGLVTRTVMLRADDSKTETPEAAEDVEKAALRDPVDSLRYE